MNTQAQEKYNGWTNWDTWAANLWLNNDEWTYRFAWSCRNRDDKFLAMYYRDLIEALGNPDAVNYDLVAWDEIIAGFRE